MEIKLDRKKDYITKSDHKEQIMKYLSWKIKPFALYHEIREISRIFNFSPEEIESILKELEDENKIFPLTAEGPRDIYNPQNHPDEFSKRNGSEVSAVVKRSGSILG